MYIFYLILSQTNGLFCQPSIDRTHLSDQFNKIEILADNLSNIVYSDAPNPSFKMGNKIFQKYIVTNDASFQLYITNCSKAYGDEFSPKNLLYLSNIMSHFATDENLIFRVNELNDKLFTNGGYEINSNKAGKSEYLGYKILPNNSVKTTEYLKSDEFGIRSNALCEFGLPTPNSLTTKINLYKLDLSKERASLSKLVTSILADKNISFTLDDNVLNLNDTDENCLKVGLEILNMDDYHVPKFITKRNKMSVLNTFKEALDNIRIAKTYLSAFKRENKFYTLKAKINNYWDFLKNLEWGGYCGLTVIGFMVSTVLIGITVTISYVCLCKTTRSYLSYLRRSLFQEVPQEDNHEI